MTRLPRVVFAAALLCAGNNFAAERWPLQYQNESTNDFIVDARAPGLVKSTIPARFANDLLDGLGGPPDLVYTAADRYFSASACVPHACMSKAFFWYDTNTGKALGAILETWDRDATLDLSSRTLSPNRIPDPALSALKHWLTDLDVTPKSAFFTNAGGRTAISVSNFQPHTGFVPPPGGPSFECRLATTAIEHEICKSPDLSKSDLRLAQLVREIRNGHSTAPAREQLREFQQSWLRSRNASCTHSRSIPDCLAESYDTQYNALMNWLPAD